MMPDIYIVDRIEENYIVLEDGKGKIINVESKYVIGLAKEGHILYKKENLYYIDEEGTRKREEEIKNLMKGLWS
ncbi:MAG: DUF3006 domain-containing protein [Clostridium sp.]|nr:DUF3006 domain-containing protein [Clostridium sp.]